MTEALEQLSYEPVTGVEMLVVKTAELQPGTVVFVNVGTADLQKFAEQLQRFRLPSQVYWLLSKGDDMVEANFDIRVLRLKYLPDDVLAANGLQRIEGDND